MSEQLGYAKLSWLKGLLGRRDAGHEPFPDGGLVLVMAHPMGTILQPHYRTKTARGYTSNLAMERAHWVLVPADATDAQFGTALRTAFGRIQTVDPKAPAHRARWAARREGTGFGTDVIRECLQLAKRGAVWRGMTGMNIRVDGASLRYVSLYSSGVPGGFEGFDPERVETCPIDADDLAFAAVFRRALSACA